MPRRLPSTVEAAEILARKRTRPPHRSAPTAGRHMSKVVKALDEKFGKGTGALAARWREIVGETLARRTEPSKLSKPRSGGGATLEIRVDGPSAALIQHQSGEILERVNLFLGKGSVEKLRIVQGPVKAAPRTGSVPKRTRKAPMDAGREAELNASLKDAPDGLREALQRLGRGVLRD
jgi:hypothetical protein